MCSEVAMHCSMSRTRAVLFLLQCLICPHAFSLPHQASQPKFKQHWFPFQMGNLHYSLPADFLLQVIGQNLATCLLFNQSLPREMAWSCQLFKILILTQLLSLLRSRAFPQLQPLEEREVGWLLSFFFSNPTIKRQFNVKKSTVSITL